MAKKEMVVTPWDVQGDIKYDRLIKQFGVKPLGKLPKQFDSHLFRRKKIFAHRDFNVISDAIKKKKPFAMMTGLMPSGKFHIGHLIVAKHFIEYQKAGAHIYLAVADIESYNTRGQSLENSKKIATEEYIANYIALGLKPKKCEIYFQSNRSKKAAQASAYYRLQNILARHGTFNEFKGVYGEITPPKMISALLQASDMLHVQLKEFHGKIPVVVPVGIDQDPHLRLARDLAKRCPYDFAPLCSTYHTFVPGLNGPKMSSSDPHSYIALSDDEKTVKKKVNKYAFSGGQATLAEHRKKGGNPDIDTSFQWLTFLEEDDKKLKKIYHDYKSGTLLSGELKALLITKLNILLKDLRKKREKAQDKIDKYLA